MGTSNVVVVVGAQWGEEGKGKVVDLLAENADVVCRCQAGNNAEHKVVVGDDKYVFHLLPSGIIRPGCVAVIGSGVVVHLPSLFEELRDIDTRLKGWQSRLVISDRSHLVFDFHQQIDELQELEKSAKGKNLGTTKKGIGPTYSSKARRNGIRFADLLDDFPAFRDKFCTLVAMYRRMFPKLSVDVEEELQKYQDYAEKIRPFVKETVTYLHRCLESGKKILVEGANGALLDIDFGTYPYVTSSNCSVGGACTGLGIPPTKVQEIVGVLKAYTTKVGEGPFPTELHDEVGDSLALKGGESGTRTGKKRRCGWLDLALLRHSAMVNGYTSLCLNKLDVLDSLKEFKVGVRYSLDGVVLDYFPSGVSELREVEVEYITMQGWQSSTSNVRKFEDLPLNAQKFVRQIEDILQVPVRWIGVGPDREAVITV